jgi:hypothetical protein
MIRTRDFFLFLLTSGFLIVAIVITVVWSYHVHPVNRSTAIQFDSKTATYTASVAAVPDTKNERLAELRKKLSEDTSINAPETPTDPVIANASPTSSEAITAPVASKILLCGKSYSPKTIAGLTGAQQYEERDNERIFFTTVVPPVDLATVTPTVAPTEQVVFTLPLRTTPLSTQSCIKDDIVAISQTGGVIRNTDYAQYQESGEATLIGYTIDGFPLYGRTSSIATDACGGATVDGQYRYYLSDERKGVLGCFAGIPVAL